jgi:hypothetical protein
VYSLDLTACVQGVRHGQDRALSRGLQRITAARHRVGIITGLAPLTAARRRDGVKFIAEVVAWCQQAITPHPAFRVAPTWRTAPTIPAAPLLRRATGSPSRRRPSTWARSSPHAIEESAHARDPARLRAGGTCIASFFPLDADSRRGIAGGSSLMPFEGRSD